MRRPPDRAGAFRARHNHPHGPGLQTAAVGCGVLRAQVIGAWSSPDKEPPIRAQRAHSRQPSGRPDRTSYLSVYIRWGGVHFCQGWGRTRHGPPYLRRLALDARGVLGPPSRSPAMTPSLPLPCVCRERCPARGRLGCVMAGAFPQTRPCLVSASGMPSCGHEFSPPCQPRPASSWLSPFSHVPNRTC
jgi:hypothetical protein